MGKIAYNPRAKSITDPNFVSLLMRDIAKARVVVYTSVLLYRHDSGDWFGDQTTTRFFMLENTGRYFFTVISMSHKSLRNRILDFFILTLVRLREDEEIITGYSPGSSSGIRQGDKSREPLRVRTGAIWLLLLTGSWFYWYEIRPAEIRSECQMHAETVVVSEKRRDGFKDTDMDAYLINPQLREWYSETYTACLHSHWL